MNGEFGRQTAADVRKGRQFDRIRALSSSASVDLAHAFTSARGTDRRVQATSFVIGRPASALAT